MMGTIAHALSLVHNLAVLKTNSTGFDSPKLQAGRTATIGGIFSSQAMKPSMGGVVGGGNPCRVPVAGLSTRHCRPPTGLTAGASGVTATTGGHDMAALPIPARSAHTFPQTEKAARRAVRTWFSGAPYLTLGEWRDHFLHRHLTGIRCDDWRERLELTAAWNEAFSASVAAHIAEVSHV